MRTKAGLIICRIGETVADIGAWMAGCRRAHSLLVLRREPEAHFKSNAELDSAIQVTEDDLT
jgi:hypothetical protein